MSQNDFNLANQGFPTMRSDMNSAFQALASNSSGATAPSTTYAYQWWYDTTANILKMRNSDNDAWVSISFFDQAANAFRILDDTQVVNASGTQTGLIGDQATATWETGTGTTESLVSPAKVKAAIDALAGGGFSYDAVSGASQALDVGAYNFFDGGTLTADTTVTFSSVPTEAKWSYTFEQGVDEAYNFSSPIDTGISFSFSGVVENPADIWFKSDGTKMYILRSSQLLYQFSLSTAWDINTASYDSVTASFSGQMSAAVGFAFKADGTKLYVSDYSNRRVYQYSLSTAWNISTVSYDSVSFSYSSQITQGWSLDFKPDGTKMYIIDAGSGAVYQYSLSTAWAINTASYDSVSFSVSGQASLPYGVRFSADGTKMFVTDAGGDNIHQYSLSTAWAINTASYASIMLPLGSLDNAPYGFFFKSDGQRAFVLLGSSKRVYEFASASGYSLTLPSAVQNPYSASVSPSTRATYDFYTADGGTNVYLIGAEIT